MKLGISGLITRAFIASPLTPLLLIVAFVLGALALASLPREEEPQISVPMVDIHVRADGLKAEDAVELITEPLEDIVKGITDVEHVYSNTMDDAVVVTARFFVGTDEDDAILRVHEEVRANLSRIPLGIPEPIIVGRGIADVPILTLTLTPSADSHMRWSDSDLHEIADELLHELTKVDEVGLTFLVGGRAPQIRVEPDPARLAQYDVTLNDLVEKVENANRSQVIGQMREANRQYGVLAGQTLKGIPDIGLLLISTRDGRPVYVKDVADVVMDAAQTEQRAWHMDLTEAGGIKRRPAVTLAIAKRGGANAVVVTEDLLERLEIVRGDLVPDNLDVLITRNYGETASDKSDELFLHLLGATVTIVAIIAVFIGWRAGLVVMVVIPVTILLTFLAAWLMGYTINRVSLFALIFSIGILVDDAIVIVENIVRHWSMARRSSQPARGLTEIAIEAVAEVGNPTIIATLTIISALLPMLFVSGLMGPYMAPIPVNASAAMVFSYLMAVVVTPWLMVRLAGARASSAQHGGAEEGGEEESGGMLGAVFKRVAAPLLASRRRSLRFLIAVGVATLLACLLFATKDVTVKLLPFDNKSEIQVVVDLPEGSSLEQTDRALVKVAEAIADLPELVNLQAYAGTASPFNFNGLVRHYYLRQQPEQGDLQVNLLPKDARDRASHEIALDVRQRLAGVDVPEGTSIKVVEVPPGPPVIATLLAEVYGPDAETRRAAAMEVRRAFEAVDFVVDVDDSFGAPTERLRFEVDLDSLEFFDVEHEAVYDTLQALVGGVPVGYSHRGHGRDPVEIKVALPRSGLTPREDLLSTPVPSETGAIVELGDLVSLKRETASFPIFRHNGRYAEMVMGDLAGAFEAPIYGMLAVEDQLEAWAEADGRAPMRIAYHGQPVDETTPVLLWDGEWEITYVTFRDMGAAFGVAIIAIYLLLVGQFSSFKLPLLILTPVPLTLVGIVIGHWLFNAPFTATSMIGFIALAGIIVRNSILLVDFIQQRRLSGEGLHESLLEAGAIRFRPIFLTAITAMVGAAFILTDPIFQGLAISLLFGLLSSTVLTVLVIPAIYLILRGGDAAA